MDAREAYPGATAWLEFNKACLNAEAALEAAERAAANERNQVVNSIPGWSGPASERVTRAANARYERKVKAAQDKCDHECVAAEAVLTQKLAQAGVGM